MATSPHGATARKCLCSSQNRIADVRNREAKGHSDENAQIQAEDRSLDQSQPLSSYHSPPIDETPRPPKKKKTVKQFFSSHHPIFVFRERSSEQSCRSPVTVRPTSTAESSGLIQAQDDHAPIATNDQAQPSRTTIGILKRLSSTLSSLFAVRRWRGLQQPSQNDTDIPSSRRAIQTSIALLDIAFSIAETVPLVGGPLKGALEALCKVLKLVDQKYRNAEGVGKLAERLATLMRTLSKLEAPDCEVLQLVEKLKAVELQLHSLLSKQRLRYSAVAQILADCRNDVNDCMQDFVTMTHIEMRAALTQINKSERLATECIIVIDPFGATQSIPKVNAASNEMVAMMILEIYSYNTALKEALTTFVRLGMYELTMTNGRQIEAITSDVLLCLSQGAKLVMNVVVVMHTKEQGPIICPTCKEIIPASHEDRAICITCDGRVSTVKSVEVQFRGPQPEGYDSELSWFRRITIHEVPFPPQYPLSIAGSGEDGAVPSETMHRIVRVFQAADTDNSGTIDPRELRATLVNSPGNRPFEHATIDMLIDIFHLSRESEDKAVEFHEFLGLSRYVEEWRGEFERADRDGSGSIDVKELKTALAGFGYNLPLRVVRLLHQKYATQSTGHAVEEEITFDQFIRACVFVEGLAKTFEQVNGPVNRRHKAKFNAFVVAAVRS